MRRNSPERGQSEHDQSAPDLIAVTLNTAIDRVVHLPAFRQGEVLEAESSRKIPAGKGVNLARAVAAIGCNVCSLGFVGEESAGLFGRIENEFIRCQFTYVKGKVRENLSLFDRESGMTTHIKTPGFSVTRRELESFLSGFRQRITPGCVVVLSGSVPPGLPPDIYADLSTMCRDSDARVMLDTNGEPLLSGLSAGPDLIAPNFAELTEITGGEVPADPEAVLELLRSSEWGEVTFIAVTLGEKGAVVFHPATDTGWYADVPPIDQIRIRNATGCGDAFLAGLAVTFLERQDPVAALQLGVACGTANLFTNAPGKLDGELVSRLKSEVEVRTL